MFTSVYGALQTFFFGSFPLLQWQADYLTIMTIVIVSCACVWGFGAIIKGFINFFR